jgi:hypothetical protein
MATKEDREMASTKEVVDNHLKCFGEGDLKGHPIGLCAGWRPVHAGRTAQGAEAMRPLFQVLIAEFGKPGAVFSMKQQFVEGEYAYILWSAETADNMYEMATDTFIVRNGKIVAQSFTGNITPKG